MVVGHLDDGESALHAAIARGLDADEFIMLAYDIAFLKGDKAGKEREAARARARPGGENWMSEPCSTCDLRSQDFGGCRCQAFFTGDASATDPVCSLAPLHELIRKELGRVEQILPVLNETGTGCYRGCSIS